MLCYVMLCYIMLLYYIILYYTYIINIVHVFGEIKLGTLV